jgi:hypothetical protein
LSDKGIDDVIAAMSKFHSMTNADFHALLPADQRHVVKVFAEIGFQDYCFRDLIVSVILAFAVSLDRLHNNRLTS